MLYKKLKLFVFEWAIHRFKKLLSVIALILPENLSGLPGSQKSPRHFMRLAISSGFRKFFLKTDLALKRLSFRRNI